MNPSFCHAINKEMNKCNNKMYDMLWNLYNFVILPVQFIVTLYNILVRVVLLMNSAVQSSKNISLFLHSPLPFTCVVLLCSGAGWLCSVHDWPPPDDHCRGDSAHTGGSPAVPFNPPNHNTASIRAQWGLKQEEQLCDSLPWADGDVLCLACPAQGTWTPSIFCLLSFLSHLHRIPVRAMRCDEFDMKYR